MSLPSRLLGANPSIQVSTLLSGSLTTPSAKGAFTPPGSMEYISSATASGSTSSLSITSIPATYTHLHARIYLKTAYTTGESNYGIRLNNDSGSNYYTIIAVGDGGTQAAIKDYAASNFGFFYTYGTHTDVQSPMLATMDIINYSDTSMKTNTIFREGVTGPSVGGAACIGGIWNDTTTVNRIDVITTGGGNLATGSRIHLYGIKGS